MISIVIAAFNEEKTLSRCLDSLEAQTAPGNSYEIIVDDDGSTDKTRQVAELCEASHAPVSAPIRVVTQSNQGAAAARNFGARHADGDILMFVDADSTADEHLVESMAAALAQSDIAGA